MRSRAKLLARAVDVPCCIAPLSHRCAPAAGKETRQRWIRAFCLLTDRQAPSVRRSEQLRHVSDLIERPPRLGLYGRHVWDYKAAVTLMAACGVYCCWKASSTMAGLPLLCWQAVSRRSSGAQRRHASVSSRAARVARSGTVRSNVPDGAGTPSPARCTKAVRSPWATAVRRSQATVIHVTVGGRHQARSRKLETRSHAAMKCADSAPADRLGWEALRTQPALVRQTIADGSHGTYAF